MGKSLAQGPFVWAGVRGAPSLVVDETAAVTSGPCVSRVPPGGAHCAAHISGSSRCRDSRPWKEGGEVAMVPGRTGLFPREDPDPTGGWAGLLPAGLVWEEGRGSLGWLCLCISQEFLFLFISHFLFPVEQKFCTGTGLSSLCFLPQEPAFQTEQSFPKNVCEGGGPRHRKGCWGGAANVFFLCFCIVGKFCRHFSGNERVTNAEYFARSIFRISDQRFVDVF